MSTVSEEVLLVASASALSMFLLLPEFIYYAEPVFVFVDGTARKYLPIQIVEPKVNKCFAGIHRIHLFLYVRL